MLTLDELRAEVELGGIDTVVTAFTDMQGRLLGKREHAEFFLDQSAEHGIELHPVLSFASSDCKRVRPKNSFHNEP